MININIPIFRAKKECDGEYIEFKTYFEEDGKYRAIIKFAKQEVDGWLDSVYIPLTFRIDPTTLTIHFPDMLDSQGNKIFASLREDGKGGDIVKYEQVLGGILKSSGPEECIVKYCNRDHIIAPFFINAKYKNQKTYMTKEHLLVIGIQK